MDDGLVAQSAHGDDFKLGPAAEAGTQAVDMDVDRRVDGVRLGAPDLVHQVAAREDPAGVGEQEEEQIELLGREDVPLRAALDWRAQFASGSAIKTTKKSPDLKRSGLFFVVETRGIEPLSESTSTRISPGAVCLLEFPPRHAGKQAYRLSRVILHDGRNS